MSTHVPDLMITIISGASILPEWLDGTRALNNLQAFWQQCNWIDIVILLGMLAGLFTGAGLGFYRSTALLFGSTTGAFMAFQFSKPFSHTPLFSSVGVELGPLGAQILAGLAIFAGSVFSTMLITYFFRSHFDRTLKTCDGVLGALMGGGIAGLVFGLILLGVFQWPDGQIHQPIRDSVIGVPLAEATGTLDHFFPTDFRDRFQLTLSESLEAKAQIVPATVDLQETRPR